MNITGLTRGASVSQIYRSEPGRTMARPLFLSAVPAGFPSPAEVRSGREEDSDILVMDSDYLATHNLLVFPAMHGYIRGRAVLRRLQGIMRKMYRTGLIGNFVS